MNIYGVNLNLLYVFHALMAERSVTRAAAKVGLSQPAMSNALVRLRTQFSDKLFVRAGRAMVPTPRAFELAPQVNAAIQYISTAFSRPDFKPEESLATFRIGTTDEIELVLMPSLMKELSSLAARVTVSCFRLQRNFVVPENELQSGGLDFAIGQFPNPAPVDSGRFANRLYQPRHVCIVRCRHPAIRQRLTLARFCKMSHAVVYYPGEGPGLIDRILAKDGHHRKARLSLPHFLSIPFVVAGSDLIATLPEPVARAVGGPLKLQYSKCPVEIPRIPVSLVWHTRTHQDPSHRWFRDMVTSVARQLHLHDIQLSSHWRALK